MPYPFGCVGNAHRGDGIEGLERLASRTRSIKSVTNLATFLPLKAATSILAVCYHKEIMSGKGSQPAGSRPTKTSGDRSNKAEFKNFALNKQAGHYYHLLEKFESGIELTGTEVKSIRGGKANLKDGYAMVRNNQLWLVNCHIGAYTPGSYLNADSIRERRLLLHRREIDKLMGRTREKGLTIVPTRLYSKGNLIKCEIALAKGKTVWDQRETLRRRTVDRETAQAINEHRRKTL